MSSLPALAITLLTAPLLALPAREATRRYVGAAPPYWLLLMTGATGAALAALVWPTASGTAGSLALVWMLVTLGAIDLRIFRLPDPLTLPLIVLGLGHSAWAGLNLVDHATGAVAGYVALAAIAAVYRHSRGREGLGLGDAKLLAAAGAWLGWRTLPEVVLVASIAALAGVATMRLRSAEITRTTPLAFGPALAFSIWLCWVFDGWKTTCLR